MRRRAKSLLQAALSLAIAAPIIGFTLAEPAAAASVTITPGTVWTDSSGHTIQAHGEGITKVGSTYYWIGEDKTNGSPFQNIKCYSSTDLKNWIFVNNLLTQQATGDLGPNRIVERPHVIYNASTSKYVMYMHIDSSSYSERKAGVATSSSVCGTYTYQGSFKPLGHDSLDDNLFLDGSTGYFMSEDRTNQKLQIYQLSSDFLSVTSLVKTLNQYEAPAMAKIGGTYFLFGSHLTGWSTNDNQYTTATSISGTWTAWTSFAPSGTNTCDSQTTSILPVQGSSTTSYVFLGDRWNSSTLSDSRYIWQPLTVSGTTASISCNASWQIDTSTGIVTTPTTGTAKEEVNVASGKCLDVPNQSTTNGVQVEIWDCNGGSNQLWTPTAAGELRVYGTSKCLDVAGATATAPGTKVEIWDCNGGANQQFVLQTNGAILAVYAGICLNPKSSGTANGTLIEINTCTGSTNQQWTRP